MQVAAPGADGRRAEELLAEASRQGVAALHDVTRAAVERLLAVYRNSDRPRRLFSPAERRRLTDTLAATIATANLLGRSRIRERQQRAEAAGKQSFADYDTQSFAAFTDPVPLLSPKAAAAYFRGLVPTLGVDPGRFGRDMRRRAFTLAEGTDETLLTAVQDAIAERLETGGQRALVGTVGDERVWFVRHGKAPQGSAAVLVDPGRLNEAWAAGHPDYYIPPGGGGAEVGGRREGFQRFLATGEPVEAPIASLNSDGSIDIEDGRHRFSVLRDMGIDQLPVMVPKAEAEAFRRRFGSDVPPERSKLTGPQAVQQLLDAAGVTPKNPSYSEMVYRTNLMDALATGAEEEFTDPDVAETFPWWQFSGVDDGRARESHRVHFGKYFRNGTSFASVRDSVKGEFDGFNCRCVMVPVSKYEVARLKRRGVRLSR